MLLGAAALMSVTVPALCAQTEAPSSTAAPQSMGTEAKLPVYEVVSIKPDKSGSGMVRMMTKPDGFSASNVTLKMLLGTSYGIREDLMSGGPGWVDSVNFDIDAKVAGADVDAMKKLNNEQRRSMLQPVLADRFKLTIHTEIKQLPVYDLVLAKSGSKLKEATVGDTYDNGIKSTDGKGGAGMMRMRPGQLNAQGVPITSLINQLAQQLHRTIIDKTGLTGKYDLTLTWTPDDTPPQEEATGDSSAPSIFTALQEQLGLKLQPSKGPVETLVIDHAEMPSEN